MPTGMPVGIIPAIHRSAERRVPAAFYRVGASMNPVSLR